MMNIVMPASVTRSESSLITTLEDLKGQVRVLHHDENADLNMKLRAANAWILKRLGRAVTTSACVSKYQCFGTLMRIKDEDNVTLTEISYRDTDGALQTVDLAAVEVERYRGMTLVNRIDSNPWPSVDSRRIAPVAISYSAGFGAVSDVPDDIKEATLLLAAHWFENRSEVVQGAEFQSIPFGVMSMINAHRRNLIEGSF